LVWLCIHVSKCISMHHELTRQLCPKVQHQIPILLIRLFCSQ
jgi:hypothetical protein